MMWMNLIHSLIRQIPIKMTLLHYSRENSVFLLNKEEKKYIKKKSPNSITMHHHWRQSWVVGAVVNIQWGQFDGWSLTSNKWI